MHTGVQPYWGLSTLGDFAVDGFFVLSGFLVVSSYLRLRASSATAGTECCGSCPDSGSAC